jgi:glucosamine 6-phosphate synthetase-like amidotransferase/phosphosugar isomerase protein
VHEAGVRKLSEVVPKIELMCGIAGYSLEPGARIARTLAAQALLAGIAERGADAVGYAHRSEGASAVVHKRRAGASALLRELSVPQDTAAVLIHVRDYTKGHPTIEANNHPVRHGPVVGIHNGIIVNDEELFSRHGFERDTPEMSVDSEAIFALAEAFGSRGGTLEDLRGSMAAAWMDDREPGAVYVARGIGRPLWVGSAPAGVFFASTKHALEVFESFMRFPLRKRELEEGTLLRLEAGRETRSERFAPDHRFEETPLPAVRAPGERESCLRLLTALAALG